jgi:hypothetical protein
MFPSYWASPMSEHYLFLLSFLLCGSLPLCAGFVAVISLPFPCFYLTVYVVSDIQLYYVQEIHVEL